MFLVIESKMSHQDQNQHLLFSRQQKQHLLSWQQKQHLLTWQQKQHLLRLQHDINQALGSIFCRMIDPEGLGIPQDD